MAQMRRGVRDYSYGAARNLQKAGVSKKERIFCDSELTASAEWTYKRAIDGGAVVRQRLMSFLRILAGRGGLTVVGLRWRHYV